MIPRYDGDEEEVEEEVNDEEQVKAALEELREYMKEEHDITGDPGEFVWEAIHVLEFFIKYVKTKEPRETETILELDQAAATLLGYAPEEEVDLEDSTGITS